MLLIDAIAIFGLAIIRKLMGDYFGTISSGFIGFFGVNLVGRASPALQLSNKLSTIAVA
jgi:hypothetical protein